MTEGEFKFAMEVEIALNKLPEPEYRQLMVEAMMVLATMVENDNCKIRMDHLIRVDSIVQEANHIFIADQVRQDRAGVVCSGIPSLQRCWFIHPFIGKHV